MKKTFIPIIITIAVITAFCACSNSNNNDNNVANSEQDDISGATTASSGMTPEIEFMAFLHHFAEDEEFQMAHIKFPIGKLSYANIETPDGDWETDDFTARYWNLEDANYMRLTAPGYFTWKNDTVIKYDYNSSLIEEVGGEFGVEYTFTKIGGEWYVTAGDYYGSDVGMADYVASDVAYRNKEYRKKHKGRFEPYVFSGTPGDYPQASDRLLTEEDLQGMSKKELRLMRNEIMARHGYTFQSADLAKHFNAFPWYSALFKNVDKLITDTEQENIKLIKAHEK